MKVRARPTAHAGVVLAIVLGALPAATVGLDVAWVVVASGASALLLAPVVAKRQVRAVQRAAPQAQLVLHAGRTSQVNLELAPSSRARHVLVDLTRVDARPSERERAPRLAIASIAMRSDAPVTLEVPVRLPVRGRTNALAITFESVYPFGLFRAEARHVAPCEVVVLPRVLRRGDRALEALLADLGMGGEVSSARPVPRGSGLPAAFRASRRDDTARDIAWRQSARRMRWISMDRTPATDDRVSIVLVTGVRGAGAAHARRSRAAFEAAVSVCATAIDRLTRAGQEVTLRFAAVDPDTSPAALAEARSRVVSRSVRALPHLFALTDVALERDESSRRVTATRRRQDTKLVIVASALSTGALPECTGAGAIANVLLVDANGRTTALASRSAPRRPAAIAR